MMPSALENRPADVKMVLNKLATGKLIALMPTDPADERLKLKMSLKGPADVDAALNDVGIEDDRPPRLVLEA